MNAYKLETSLEISSNITRTVKIPGNITFKKIHEIICILYNINVNDKYEFIFQDIGLIIHDTGTLNRDSIDSRFELIDEYFQRYSEIRYSNSKWNINIKISDIKYVKKYPEIIEINGKFNPKTDNLPEEYIKAINSENKNSLNEINKIEMEDLLLLNFNIPHTIENNQIIILKKGETLEKYV